MNISRQSGERREPGARVESELQHFVLLFLAMHERERGRERERSLLIFSMWSRRDSSMAVTPWRDLISSQPETKT